MTLTKHRSQGYRLFLFALTALIGLSGCKSSGPSSSTRTIQPGAPGQSSQIVSSESVSDVKALAYTRSDVEFMQGMIPHHAQALDMTALILEAPDKNGVRESRPDGIDLMSLAQRISISQKGEIQLMQKWLSDRGQIVPEATAQHMMNGESMLMPGMLTSSQMSDLTISSGKQFYTLFLEYMISHHEGAITMVSELFSSPGAAQDTDIFRFASDVESDQQMEIARMQDMLSAAY